MDFNETAKAVGFRDGDILVSADGVPLERYNSDMLTSIVDARQVTVLRNGSEASIYIPEDMMERLLADSVRFAAFRTPFVIDSIPAGTPASLAGLLPGDNITHVDATVNPVRDKEIIDFELQLKDLETIESRNSKVQKQAQTGGDKAAKVTYEVLSRYKEALEQGKAARTVTFETKDEQKIAHDLFLLTN